MTGRRPSPRLIWRLERAVEHAGSVLSLAHPDVALNDSGKASLHAKSERLMGDLVTLLEMAKSGGFE